MDYNTQRKHLILPEYGRNIQNMVDLTLEIKDKEERKKSAQAIIAVMGSMNPHLRDVPDFKHILWDHLAIMSNFILDIDAPFDLPDPETLIEKPKKIPYSSNKIKYRHYGKTIERMILRASEYEEGNEKNVLIELIANHMKKSYLVWNRDAVEDEFILNDMKRISKDTIVIPEDLKLIETKDILSRNKRVSNQKNNPKRNPKRR